MQDRMLAELYRRVFEEKRVAEAMNCESGEAANNRLMIALAKNKLLSELIDIRTEQIRGGIE